MSNEPNQHLGNDKERVQLLLESLRSQADSALCDDCFSQLEGYIEAQLAGDNYLARYPRMAMLLDTCLECAEAYARLYELEIAAANLPLTTPLSAPDLSFLQTETEAASSEAQSLVALIRAGLERLGDQVRFQFSADLLSLLQPPASLAATRTPPDADRYADVLFVFEPKIIFEAEAISDSPLPITMTAYRDKAEPEQCLIEIIVEPEGISWPELAGTEVILTWPEESLAAITDVWGLVSFPAVPVAQIPQIQVSISLPSDPPE